MKYFTKEWYELCQKTSAHLLLKESEEAGIFSEEFFSQLYDQKLNEWLTLQKEVSEVSFDEVFPAEMNVEFLSENLSDEEILEFKEEYRINREASKVKFDSREPFDADEQTDNFQKALQYRVAEAPKMLPKYILDTIADLRVFALGKATKQVIKAVTDFCEDNSRAVESTVNQYSEYYNKAILNVDKETKDVFERLNFHDCIIKEVRQSEQELILLLDNSGGFTNIEVLRFENYEIIKQESPLEETWWLYEEIYSLNGRYELHALLLINNNESRLVEFTISAEKITFREGLKKLRK